MARRAPRKARAVRGRGFDVRRFRDPVMGNGWRPLTRLERLDGFLGQEGKR